MKRTFLSVLAGLTSLVLGAGILGVAAPPAAGPSMDRRPPYSPREWAWERSPTGTFGASSGSCGLRVAPSVQPGSTSTSARQPQRRYEVYKKNFGFPADGVVGPKTRKLLRVLCAERMSAFGKGSRSGTDRRTRGARRPNQSPPRLAATPIRRRSAGAL